MPAVKFLSQPKTLPRCGPLSFEPSRHKKTEWHNACKHSDGHHQKDMKSVQTRVSSQRMNGNGVNSTLHLNNAQILVRTSLDPNVATAIVAASPNCSKVITATSIDTTISTLHLQYFSSTELQVVHPYITPHDMQ